MYVKENYAYVQRISSSLQVYTLGICWLAFSLNTIWEMEINNQLILLESIFITNFLKNTYVKHEDEGTVKL